MGLAGRFFSLFFHYRPGTRHNNATTNNTRPRNLPVTTTLRVAYRGANRRTITYTRTIRSLTLKTTSTIRLTILVRRRDTIPNRTRRRIPNALFLRNTNDNNSLFIHFRLPTRSLTRLIVIKLSRRKIVKRSISRRVLNNVRRNPRTITLRPYRRPLMNTLKGTLKSTTHRGRSIIELRNIRLNFRLLRNTFQSTKTYTIRLHLNTYLSLSISTNRTLNRVSRVNPRPLHNRAALRPNANLANRGTRDRTLATRLPRRTKGVSTLTTRRTILPNNTIRFTRLGKPIRASSVVSNEVRYGDMSRASISFVEICYQCLKLKRLFIEVTPLYESRVATK